MQKIVLITHELEGVVKFRGFVQGESAVVAAQTYVETEYIPELERKVRAEWEGSSEETIKDYLPEFKTYDYFGSEPGSCFRKYSSENSYQEIMLEHVESIGDN